MKTLGSFFSKKKQKTKQVSLQYCGEFRVKLSVGLIHSGCGAEGRILVTSSVAEINLHLR